LTESSGFSLGHSGLLGVFIESRRKHELSEDHSSRKDDAEAQEGPQVP